MVEVSGQQFSGRQQRAVAHVDELTDEMEGFHAKIWEYSEPAWREYRSAKAYVDLLRGEGFDVEEGSGGMPTAFHATWGDSGPRVGLYAEYDATPGFSQAPVPRKQPRPGMHDWAPGFTDAHSTLGVGAVTGAIALKRTLEANGGGGRIDFFGEPAEKACGSKPIHAAKGYYDPLDFCISYHPTTTNCVQWDMQFCDYWSVVFTFQTTDREPWPTPRAKEADLIEDPSMITRPGLHAGGSSVRSPGALDALAQMITSVKLVKEQMFSRTGHWSLNEAILGASSSTANNYAQKISQIQYTFRSPIYEVQEQILTILKRVAKSTASITNTEVSMQWVSKTRPGLKHHSLSQVVYDTMVDLGPEPLPEAAYEFGRELERELGREPSEDPFVPHYTTTMTPHEQDDLIRAILPPWQECVGTDDYTEYTWHTPTARFGTTKLTLNVIGEDMRHWAHNAMTGYAPTNNHTWVYAAKIIAVSALQVMDDPALLASITEEWETRKAQSPRVYQKPLFDADIRPPVDLPWPEYHETVRGYEWILPTTDYYGEPLD